MDFKFHRVRNFKSCKNSRFDATQNCSSGWDVIATENGLGLIEENHDWYKLLWQLPVKKGMKKWLQSIEKEDVA